MPRSLAGRASAATCRAEPGVPCRTITGGPAGSPVSSYASRRPSGKVISGTARIVTAAGYPDAVTPPAWWGWGMAPEHPGLTEADVIARGGWHPRYARVLALA